MRAISIPRFQTTDQNQRNSMLLMEKVLMALKNAKAQIQTLGSPTDEVNNAHLDELAELIQILEESNPDKDDFFYWILEVGIHKVWVADGIDFTDERAHGMFAKYFGYLHGSELKAKVLSRPSDKAVAEEMGFKSVSEYIEDRQKE